METKQILALLVIERDRLNNAIEALQEPTKRTDRPSGSVERQIAKLDSGDQNMPDWVKPKAKTVPPKHTRNFSPAQRKKQAERMKAYWAAKKKVEAKPVAKKKAGRAG